MQAEFPPPDAFALWLVNVIDHNPLPLMIAWTSLSRNRTPAHFTRVSLPEFASRSTERSEQASFSATCFLRSKISFWASVFIIVPTLLVQHVHRLRLR